jgi:hypothetical protein
VKKAILYALRNGSGDVLPRDYELRDHTTKRRKLSGVQGEDPLVLVLSRGGFRVHVRLIDADRYTLTMRDEKGKVADGPLGENLDMLEALNAALRVS